MIGLSLESSSCFIYVPNNVRISAKSHHYTNTINVLGTRFQGEEAACLEVAQLEGTAGCIKQDKLSNGWAVLSQEAKLSLG